MCSILFFKYGITPTTNRLYQLVRKGSMQTVTTSLGAFWEDLRERSRLKIDHPGVPESLIRATGDLVQAIWEKANIEAEAFYEAAKAEAASNVELAQAKQLAAEKQRDDAEETIDALETNLAATTNELKAVLATIEAEKHAHGATSARLEEARAEVLSLRLAVAEARQDFANELEKARAATRGAEEREASAERRMLLELDRERTMRSEAELAANQLRDEMNAANRQASNRIEMAADEIGQLKGKLTSAAQNVERCEGQLASARDAASSLTSNVARCNGEMAAGRDRIAALERALEVANSTKSKAGRSRKA